MFKEALMPTPKKKEAGNEEVLRQEVLDKFKSLKEATPSSPEFMKLSYEAYISLEKLLSAKAVLYDDISKLYYKYLASGRQLIVRREDPKKSLELALGGKLEMSFDPKVVADRGDKYANCALWPYGGKTMAGIANALKEGKSSVGPIVSVLAILPDPETAEVSEPEGKMWNIADLDRTAVKILSGTVNAKDLRFMVIRMPRKFFPPERLTDKEKDSSAPEIFRGFEFAN